MDFTAQLEVVGADIIENPIDEEVKSQSVDFEPFLRPLCNDAEICRSSQRAPARLYVQNLLGL